MAATESTMLALGTPLPSFSLSDAVTGQQVSAASLSGGTGALVMFICNHCPYVVHIRPVLVELAHRAMAAGFKVVAINSNSVVTHPQDGPAAMKALATAEGWKFPFLFDETQAVAKSFAAACTPDFFLFDRAQKLAYRGQFDDARPSKPVPVTGRDLQAAINAVAEGRSPAAEQRASIGCNIKWAPR